MSPDRSQYTIRQSWADTRIEDGISRTGDTGWCPDNCYCAFSVNDPCDSNLLQQLFGMLQGGNFDPLISGADSSLNICL